METITLIPEQKVWIFVQYQHVFITLLYLDASACFDAVVSVFPGTNNTVECAKKNRQYLNNWF